jgi:hypothetical protein
MPGCSVQLDLNVNAGGKIQLHQSIHGLVVGIDDIQRFLGRDFAPGERVARYSFAHLNRLAHE